MDFSGVPSPRMDWESTNLPDAWRKFKQHVELMFTGPLKDKGEVEKCSYLLLWIGEKGRDIYNTWTLTEAESKGLVSNLTFGADIVTGWEVYSLSIDQAVSQGLLWEMDYREAGTPPPSPLFIPSFYGGTFVIPDGIPDLPQDTYIHFPDWRKGQVWINGFNLGRYWPARGPQITLYVPASILSTAAPNNVTVLELEGDPCTPGPCTVEFANTPVLNATVKSDHKHQRALFHKEDLL